MRAWRVWIAAGLVLALVLIFAAVDRQRKRPPHAGFAPSGAAWTLFTPDITHMLAAFERTPALADTVEAVDPYIGQFQRAVRLKSGIRPTPARWRLWFGPQFLLWGHEQTWATCLHPGVLLRLAHAFNAAGQPGVSDGVYTYRGLHYVWRGSFLVVSPQREAVVAVLDAPMYPANAGPPHRFLFTWTGPPQGALTLGAGPDGPLRGTLQLDAAAAQESAPARLPLPPAARPLAISARNWRDIAAVFSLAAPLLNKAGNAELATVAATLAAAAGFANLPEDWDRDVSALLLSLHGVDTTGEIPIPLISLALEDAGAREAHPLAPLAAPGHALAHAWGRTPGTMAPVWGSAFTVCMAQQPPYWLATSQQPLMQEMLETPLAAQGVEADMAVLVGWREVADLCERVLRLLAEAELLEERGPGDLDRELMPLVQSQRAWGNAYLLGRAQGAQLHFEGNLFGAEDSTP